jgi:competence protein ComEA
MLAAFFFSIITTPVTASTTAQPPPAGKSSSESSANQKVNINSADVETLCTLKGIGPSLALRIKEFREQHGPFKKAEDITQVRGVGETILEWNKNLIDIK